MPEANGGGSGFSLCSDSAMAGDWREVANADQKRVGGGCRGKEGRERGKEKVREKRERESN